MAEKDPVNAALLRSSAKAFYVGSDRTRSGKTIVTIHAAKSVTTTEALDSLRREMTANGLIGAIRLRRHSDQRLARARSLEGFVKSFAHSTSLYDATGAIDRGQALVDFARTMRGELGEKLVGLYWNSRWRTAYVVLNHKHFVRDEKLKEADLIAMEQLTLKSLVEATAHLGADFKPAIRLSFELPTIALVPIDRRSEVARRSLFGFLRSNMMMPALSAMIGFGSVGMAAADEPAPAVSGINGKIAVIGGYADADQGGESHSGLVAGSLTIPGDTQFGVQFDAAGGRDGGSITDGLGGHFFWRDPTKALLGLTVAHVEKRNDSNPDQSVSRVGGEGELYLDQFTVSARGGYQFGSNVDDGTYSGIDLSWYATDNLKFAIGADNDPQNDTTGHIGTEFQPGLFGLSGLSVFADGVVGDDGYTTASVGIRFYFGASNKSLKDRHRYDDPEDNLALDGLKTFTGKSSNSNFYGSGGGGGGGYGGYT